MKKISYKDKNYKRALAPLFDRTAYPPEIEDGVKKMLDEIREKGNSAVAKFAKKFDGASMTPAKFKVSDKEIKDAIGKVDSKKKKAINDAVKNVKEYALRQIPKAWNFSPRAGVKVGERFVPLERVGVYIPGGTAPLVSTVVHTAAIAKTAGVKEIVAITPPGKNGEVLPELLYAMQKSGVTEVYRLGGVYGVGALAYGTRTIQKVEENSRTR